LQRVKDGLAQKRGTHAATAGVAGVASAAPVKAAPAKAAKAAKPPTPPPPAGSAAADLEIAAAVFEITTLLNRGEATRALALLHQAVARHGERPDLLALRKRLADALLDGLGS
ncbi:MAG TPA: hypothetical protein VGE98_02770, partial [Thermoanaerobaculia bacterium]